MKGECGNTIYNEKEFGVVYIDAYFANANNSNNKYGEHYIAFYYSNLRNSTSSTDYQYGVVIAYSKTM